MKPVAHVQDSPDGSWRNCWYNTCTNFMKWPDLFVSCSISTGSSEVLHQLEKHRLFVPLAKVTFTSLIDGCAKRSKPKHAAEWLRIMVAQGLAALLRLCWFLFGVLQISNASMNVWNVSFYVTKTMELDSRFRQKSLHHLWSATQLLSTAWSITIWRNKVYVVWMPRHVQTFNHFWHTVKERLCQQRGHWSGCNLLRLLDASTCCAVSACLSSAGCGALQVS